MQQLTHGAIIPLAGGFSIGATSIIGAPPKIIFSFKAFENNDKLYLRYLKQHGFEVPYYQLDDMDKNHMKFFIKKYGKIDFFHSVPPCSGLSQAAQRAKGSRGTCEVNDWLYKAAEFILCCANPTVYAFENAPGLWTSSGEIVRERLIQIGLKYGYAITFYKTNTIKHGIPQFRPRTFGIYYKGCRAPILNYYNKETPLLAEYLKQIPKNTSLQDKYMNCDSNINEYEITKFFKKIYGEDWKNEIYKTYRCHLTSYDYLKRKNLTQEFRNFLDTLPNASEIVIRNTDHVIKKTEMGKNFRLGYRVLGLDRDYVYAVITEMMNRTLHPVEERLINIREHMHLMGLPHDYELDGPKEYSKITQNVPVNTCMDITAEIVEIIKGNRMLSNNFALMQDNTKQNTNIITKSLF